MRKMNTFIHHAKQFTLPSVKLSRSLSTQIIGRLEDQVCIITGASGGVGRESALLFASEGAKVVVADINEQEGRKTVDMIHDVNTSRNVATFVKCDVSKAKEVAHAVEKAEQKYGKLTIMFNNAGIMHSSDGDADMTDDSVWDMTMNINVKGVFYGCKYAIPAIKRAGGGSIINTASFVGFLGAATPQLAYTTSKGAVLAMTRELAAIHARENIRVNSLCPGPLNTPLLQKFLDDEEKRQKRLVHIPMGRFGEAYEMATAALFLASNDASFVTGTSLMVDGGITSTYTTSDIKTDPFGGPEYKK